MMGAVYVDLRPTPRRWAVVRPSHVMDSSIGTLHVASRMLRTEDFRIPVMHAI